MVARLTSLVVWALVAVATVAWGLRLAGRGTPVPAHAMLASSAGPAAQDFTRALGRLPVQAVEPAVAAPAANDGRFQLVGVVAPGAGRSHGLALVAVDGKPARTVRAGRELEPGLVLKSVSHRRVELVAEGRPPVVLELPPLPEAQRGRPDGTPAGAPVAGTVSARIPALPVSPPTGAAIQPGMTPPQRLGPTGMVPAQGIASPPALEAAPVQAEVPTDGQPVPQR
jgi:general secretion pathway protein C